MVISVKSGSFRDLSGSLETFPNSTVFELLGLAALFESRHQVARPQDYRSSARSSAAIHPDWFQNRKTTCPFHFPPFLYCNRLGSSLFTISLFIWFLTLFQTHTRTRNSSVRDLLPNRRVFTDSSHTQATVDFHADPSNNRSLARRFRLAFVC